ncbi:aldo/keto reductase [Microbacterium awajiense]|uniref:Aldo/keto reductase n=1 Tax=Microbacterium awajiense TaxID=415214 RepID=A0ABP7AQF2_9MICO
MSRGRRTPETTVTVRALRGRIAEGCGRFSTAPEVNHANAVATVRAAYDAGLRVFDTARAYATVGDPLHNERLLTLALRDRDDVIIMTKGGHFRSGVAQWGIDNTPARLRRDVDDSLRALERDRLDLYYLHRADGPVDILESFGALEELRRAGKIGAIGISNATVAQIEVAATACRLTAVQNRLVAGERSDSLRCAERLGLAFFAYSPLGGPAHAKDLPQRFPALAKVAAKRHRSVHALALRGMLADSDAVSAIVGIGSPRRAAETAAVPSTPWDDECARAWAADIDHPRADP